MKKLFLALFIIATVNSFSQTKNLTDKPYIEVSGQADTLVMPNKIWINVLLTEKESKGKKSVEDLEKEMLEKLQEIGIDIEKNVSLNDMTSNFKNYFLKQTDIFKAKSYSIIVTDAKTTSRVFIAFESIGISNTYIEKVENSEEKEIQLLINGKAAKNAKQIAESYSIPLSQKIGNAIQISNNINIPNQLTSRASGVAIRGMVSISNSNRSTNYEPDIQFEKIKISSNIQVRFLLE